MRAARFDAFSAPIEICHVPDPECPPDGAIIEVRACGVCRSDWHSWKGADEDVTPPHIAGHEFAGIVREVGPDCRTTKPGDRVTAPFVIACGKCEDCARGEATICSDQVTMGFTEQGAFAELVAVPRADFNLVRIPESMDFVDAAGMGCRMTTAFRGVVDRGQVKAGEWISVHGCGGVGLSVIMIARALGARPVAIDVNAEALELARELGAEVCIDASLGEHLGEAVREVTGGGAHVSVDALGITATFHDAIHGLRPMGRHVQIGLPTGSHANPKIPLLDIVYGRQISLMGTRGLPASRFPALLEMVADGRLDPARLVTKRITLNEVGAAIAAMDSYTGSGITVIDRI